MKKIDQIMAELGFNKNAPRGTKEAFIKHLLAHAGVHVVTPTEEKEILENPQQVKPLLKPQQLAFSFIEDGKAPTHKSRKAVS